MDGGAEGDVSVHGGAGVAQSSSSMAGRLREDEEMPLDPTLCDAMP